MHYHSIREKVLNEEIEMQLITEDQKKKKNYGGKEDHHGVGSLEPTY